MLRVVGGGRAALLGLLVLAFSSTGGCSGKSRYVPNEPGLLLPKQYGGQPLASLNVVTGDQQPFHSHILHVVVTTWSPSSA